jgi:hypothetical protein
MSEGTTRPRRRDRQRDSELEKLRARRIASLLTDARTMLGIPAAPREQVLMTIAMFLSQTMEEIRGLATELYTLENRLAGGEGYAHEQIETGSATVFSTHIPDDFFVSGPESLSELCQAASGQPQTQDHTAIEGECSPSRHQHASGGGLPRFDAGECMRVPGEAQTEHCAEPMDAE